MVTILTLYARDNDRWFDESSDAALKCSSRNVLRRLVHDFHLTLELTAARQPRSYT